MKMACAGGKHIYIGMSDDAGNDGDVDGDMGQMPQQEDDVGSNGLIGH